jgi:hypothetical protein
LYKELAKRTISYKPTFNFKYFCNYEDYYKKTKPTLDESVMNPREISILEQLFPTMTFTDSNFAGQQMNQPYRCFDVSLFELPRDTKSYIFTSINSINGFIDNYLEIFKHGNNHGASTLRERKRVLKDFVL